MNILINVDTKRLSNLSGSLPVILDQFIYNSKIPFNISLVKNSGSNSTEPVTENMLLTTVMGSMSVISSSILFQDTHSLLDSIYTGTLNVSGSSMKTELYRNSGSVDVNFQIKSVSMVTNLTDVIYNGLATIRTNVI
jgi:hypothetical protein